MKLEYLLCFLSVAMMCIACVGIGFAYTSSMETQNTIQSEWCTLVTGGNISIDMEGVSFTTSSIEYSSKGEDSGLINITFQIGAPIGKSLEGSTLSVSLIIDGSEFKGACILNKSPSSTFSGTISGFGPIVSGTSFSIIGQINGNGGEQISSVEMELTAYPVETS